MTVMMKVFQVLLLLNFIWTLTRGDTNVSCKFGESCIIPCKFLPIDNTFIFWTLMPGKVHVHGFFENQDQLAEQDQQFKGRTSLFPDRISEGNASLLLTGVKVQDEGRYQCDTFTIEEGKETSYVNVKVTAPLQKINMTQTKNLIICSSDEIYPEPHLSWSISPPSSRTFRKTTTVHKTEKHLYNISSSLTLSDSEEDLDHICTISTPSKQRRAAWRRRHSVTIISGEATISCSSSDTPLLGFSLVWRFNQREIIVTKNEDDEHRVSEEWKQHVKDVSESGRLTLQHLSADHEGTYTCEVSNDGDTSMAQISLRLAEGKDNSHGGIVAAIVILPIIGLVIYCIGTKLKRVDHKIPETQSQSLLKVTKSEEERITN